MLAIDPASGATSQPGWAAFSQGKLLKSGTLQLPRGMPIQQRLRELFKALSLSSPDVLVIERIRGSMAHEHLKWSVGVSIAATCASVVIEMPVSTWKKHAGPNHVKSDVNDAEAIGHCLIACALSSPPTPPKKKKSR